MQPCMMTKGEYEWQATKVFHLLVIENFGPIPSEIDCIISVLQGIGANITYNLMELRHQALLVRSQPWA